MAQPATIQSRHDATEAGFYRPGLALKQHRDPEQAWAAVSFESRGTLQSKARCFCKCHERKQIGRFRLAPFASVAGSLVVLYSGWALAGQHCDTASCCRFNVKSLEVTYSFPRNSLNITVFAFLKIFDSYPTIGLKVARRIPFRSIDFCRSLPGLARGGLCSEVRAELERRPDAVGDVRDDDGAGALWFAIAYGRLDVAKLLLAAGADPFVNNVHGFPAISAVGNVEGAVRKELEKILPLWKYYEDFNFSTLHKAVAQQSHRGLLVELSSMTGRTQVNDPNDVGRTPLHLAADLGDHIAVRMLLQAGANPEMRDSYGSTALQLAVQRSKICVRELLRGGADPDVPVFHIENFHLSSSLEPSCEAISLLIAYGADVNDRRNRYNTSMLAKAASKDRFDSCDSCKYLLMHGGDINHVDIDGDTPLSETIRKNRHDALKSLLSKNPGYHHVNNVGQTVLHIAAMAGNTETVQILADAGLTGLDPEAQDCRGWTASKTFEERLGVSNATKDAFRTLIESVNEAGRMIRRKEDGPISGDKGEEFFDALETL